MMYASEFLDAKDAKVRSAAVYAIWNIARNHPEYRGDNVKAILNRILPMLDGEDARYDIDALKKHLAEMPDEVGFVSIFNGRPDRLERLVKESDCPREDETCRVGERTGKS